MLDDDITSAHWAGIQIMINHLIVDKSYAWTTSLVDVTNIKHVSVLKSGAAAAAYGVQGSNGVIEITTKKWMPPADRMRRCQPAIDPTIVLPVDGHPPGQGL